MLLAGQPPKYAIVRLGPTDDVFRLFRLLVENNYQEVSFVNELKEYTAGKNGLTDDKSAAGLAKLLSANAAAAASSAVNASNRIKPGAKPASTQSTGGTTTTSTTNALTQRAMANLAAAAVAGNANNSGDNNNNTGSNNNSGSGSSNSTAQQLGQLVSAAASGNFNLSLPFLLANNALLEQTLLQANTNNQNGNGNAGGGNKKGSVAVSNNGGGVGRNRSHNSLAPIDLSGERKAMLGGGGGGGRQRTYQRDTLDRTYASQQQPKRSTTPLSTNSDGTDSSGHATCGLCQNRIMASRLSNLTNHVRRHAMLKQFQCCYCEYTHNEMAKVRLHMLHNHKDKDSQPIDNLNPEMQAQWDMLMSQCFPQFAKDKNGNSTSLMSVAARSAGSGNERLSMVTALVKTEAHDSDGSLDGLDKSGLDAQCSTCVECGDAVHISEQLEHINRVHGTEHVYTCDSCSHESPNLLHIQLHVSSVHHREPGSSDTGYCVTEAPASTTVLRYFPDAKDSDGHRLVANELRESSGMLTGHADIKTEEPDAELFDDRGAFEQADADRIPVDQSDPALADVYCKLCHRSMPRPQSVQSLVAHTSHHYRLKQYKCSLCVHCGLDREQVQEHIQHRHAGSGSAHVVHTRHNTDGSMWLEAAAQCFPSAAAKFKRSHLAAELTDLLVDASANANADDESVHGGTLSPEAADDGGDSSTSSSEELNAEPLCKRTRLSSRAHGAS